MHEEFADRFWARVDKNGPTVREDLGPCWIWTGSKLPRGYGRFYPKFKLGLNAHVVSWEIANNRSVPDGEEVCHECDNPPCVRPDHLFNGSAVPMGACPICRRQG